jgi:hypothetical protein
MSVLRKRTKYATIANAALEDSTLSLKAKGLLALLLSRPDGWVYRFDWIVKQSQDGRDSVAAGLKELEVAGYLKRVQSLQQGGRFGVPEYHITDDIKNKPLTGLPLTEEPLTVEPQTAEPSTEKGGDLSKTELTKPDLSNPDIAGRPDSKNAANPLEPKAESVEADLWKTEIGQYLAKTWPSQIRQINTFLPALVGSKFWDVPRLRAATKTAHEQTQGYRPSSYFIWILQGERPIDERFLLAEKRESASQSSQNAALNGLHRGDQVRLQGSSEWVEVIFASDVLVELETEQYVPIAQIAETRRLGIARETVAV